MFKVEIFSFDIIHHWRGNKLQVSTQNYKTAKTENFENYPEPEKKKKPTSVSAIATNDRIDLLGAEGLNHRSH